MSKYHALWDCIKNYNGDTVTLTFAEIGEIAGISLDHAFLQYKKELVEYSWKVSKISMKEQKVTFEKC